MKKVLGGVTLIAFALFAIGVLGLLMSLTYQALERIFPTSFINQIWGLILFDIAVLVWGGAFAFQSHTIGQYSAAATGFLVGFIGTLVMVGAEVTLASDLITINPEEIGQWLVYGFILATIAHVSLLWLHHFSGRELRQQIDVGIAKGTIVSQAIKDAEREMDKRKNELAQTLADDIVNRALLDLGLTTTKGTIFDTKRAETPAPTLRTGVWVPEAEYRRLEKLYPPYDPSQPPPIITPKDEPTAAPAPFPIADSPSETSGTPGEQI